MKQVLQTITRMEKLINYGDASLDRVEQLKKEIKVRKNQVNMLIASEQI